MANRLHLSILERGVEEWNNWRKDNPDIKPDLSRSEIFGSNTHCFIWRGKIDDAPKAAMRSMTRINFEDCNLEGCQIRKINFCYADFTRANLRRTSIKKCLFEQCSFFNAKLIEIDLHDTSWGEVDFSHANLEDLDFFANASAIGNATLLELAIFRGAFLKNVNFSGAILAGANFEAARLERVNFAAADLSNADLTGANLAGSNFSKADLSNADLIGADLAGSDFSGASLERADLTGANLAGSNFSQADLKEGNLDGTNLRGANFDLANLTRASLKTAMLFQANLKNSREVETAFLDNAIYEDVPWEPQPDPIEDDAELFPPTITPQAEPQHEIVQSEGQMVPYQDIEFLKMTIQEISERLPLPNVKSGDLQGLVFKSKSELKIAEVLEEQGILFFPNAVLRITSVEGERKTREVDFLIFHQGAWGVLEVDGPFHTPERRVTEQEQERAFKKAGILVYERFDSLRCHNHPEEVVTTFLSVLKNLKA